MGGENSSSSMSIGSSSVVVLDVMLCVHSGLYSARNSLVLSVRLQIVGMREILSSVIILVLVFLSVFVCSAVL